MAVEYFNSIRPRLDPDNSIRRLYPLGKHFPRRGNGQIQTGVGVCTLGVRNFRTVLYGVLYRGGANNYYHRGHPRSNTHPLPEDGIQNLCEEGFGLAIYLYPDNFNAASHARTCASLRGPTFHLTYRQISPLVGDGARQILEIVHEDILT